MIIEFMGSSEKELHRQAKAFADKISVTHFKSPVAWNTEEHVHSKGQIILFTSGTASMRTKDGHWILPTTRTVYIPPGQRHSLRVVTKVTGLTAYLPPNQCARLWANTTFLRTAPFLTELLKRLAHDDMDMDTPEKARLAIVLVDELLRSTQVGDNLPQPSDPRLAALTRLMMRNPKERQTLKAYAADAGMSERTLLRHFREETGLSVIAWRQHAIILMAAEKLSLGWSVKKTAIASGYDNASSFIAAFRRVMDVTPVNWIALLHEKSTSRCL